VTNEPKTAAAKARLAENTTEEIVHSEYRHLILSALQEANDNYQGKWCLPRSFVACSTTHEIDKKRKRPADAANSLDEDTGKRELPDGLLSSCEYISASNASCHECPSTDPIFHANCSPSPQQCDIQHHRPGDQPQVFTFRIPPQATFSLSDCTSPRSFLAGVRNQAQTHSTRRHFDIILLDPPWPNRSAKRARKTPASASYATLANLDDIYELLAGMDLDMLMAEDCLVAIWITNKPSTRELVLGEYGIFAMWGLELDEEWVWLKTTVDGEPISPIDSAWRKPYETLLIGRRRRHGVPGGDGPKRRVIMSVPDLHSRKPCLKNLLEPMAAQPSDCRVLEVFARHLVAGWWSWGNECIKYNWDGFWRSPSSSA
jgi:N6-adenosine-specific RNA methylase IME4